MTQPVTLETVRAARRAYEVSRARATQLEHARDDAIRGALDAGYPVADVADAAGVSKPRVYQIRDRRR